MYKAQNIGISQTTLELWKSRLEELVSIRDEFEGIEVELEMYPGIDMTFVVEYDVDNDSYNVSNLDINCHKEPHFLLQMALDDTDYFTSIIEEILNHSPDDFVEAENIDNKVQEFKDGISDLESEIDCDLSGLDILYNIEIPYDFEPEDIINEIENVIEENKEEK